MKALLFFLQMVSNQSLDQQPIGHEEVTMKAGTRTLWTFAITSIALFMVVLDNLVVSTALPVIRVDLGASIEELEWIVNAYTLHLRRLPADGRRARRPLRPQAHVHARRRPIFTVASALAALAPSTDWLIAARALQGFGARDRDPAHADHPQRRRLGRASRPRARRVVRASPASPSRWGRSSAAPWSRGSPGSGSSG